MIRIAEQGRADASDFQWLNLLQCPNCFGKIELREGRWRCTSCDTVYPSAGEAPDFLTGNSGVGAVEDNDENDFRRRRGVGAVRRLYRDLRRRLEVELISIEAQRLDRALDIVDLGANDLAASGTYHSWIKSLARTYLGVEPSLPLVRSAVPTATVGVVRGNGEQPLLRPNAVDVAICLSALDDCVDPELVLHNIAEALREEGCALIELKNVSAWYRPLYAHSPRWLQRRVAPPEHVHPWNFSPKLLACQLRTASFRSVELYDLLYFAPFLRTTRLDWMPRLLGSERSRRWLARADSFGRALAAGRGGSFIALARK